jgi:protein-disulfide isomerase
MAQNGESSPRSPAWTAIVWPLVTGVAIGFMVGRETARRGSGDSDSPSAAAEKSPGKVPSGTKMPAKIFKSESEFPDGWTKSADFASVTSVSLDGLSAAQKTTLMQALNERDCECGCGMGKIAGCIKKDPNCPRSPNLAKAAIEVIKQGKGMGEILAAIDDKQKPAGGGSPSAPAAAAAGGSKKVLPFAHNLRRGPKAAKVTIVEFSDFECPFCNRSEPTVKGLLDKYGKDVSLVWMNQPLPFHSHAMDAAVAFQAAGRQNQDKAWKLHDKMYENNKALTRPDIEKYATEVGLDVNRLKKDWDDAKIKGEIADDQKVAGQVGATGTPTFFINGREIVGAQEASAFEKIIDDEIKQADALIKKGTPLKDVYSKRLEMAAAAPAPAPAPAPAAPEGQADIKLGDSPVKGPASAPVTVIAFSDFQCPFCSRAVPTLHDIEKQYGNKVRIAFKQLPLPFHDKAHLAAQASLAANEQGKFWAYHDKLFANQQALDRPSLEKYAQELGLDMGKFKKALDSGKFKDKVDAEAKEGAAVGATGTPTFFINGTKLVGAQPTDAFKVAIDKELKGKG